jgi:hypothetical protein
VPPGATADRRPHSPRHSDGCARAAGSGHPEPAAAGSPPGSGPRASRGRQRRGTEAAGRANRAAPRPGAVRCWTRTRGGRDRIRRRAAMPPRTHRAPTRSPARVRSGSARRILREAAPRGDPTHRPAGQHPAARPGASRRALPPRSRVQRSSRPPRRCPQSSSRAGPAASPARARAPRAADTSRASHRWGSRSAHPARTHRGRSPSLPRCAPATAPPRPSPGKGRRRSRWGPSRQTGASAPR